MTWLFYGHGNEEKEYPQLRAWMLVDMRVWRREIMRVGWVEAERIGMVARRSNGDGSHFVACDVTKYPADLLIDVSVEPFRDDAP
jgi:hypothetical protein